MPREQAFPSHLPDLSQSFSRQLCYESGSFSSSAHSFWVSGPSLFTRSSGACFRAGGGGGGAFGVGGRPSENIQIKPGTRWGLGSNFVPDPRGGRQQIFGSTDKVGRFQQIPPAHEKPSVLEVADSALETGHQERLVAGAWAYVSKFKMASIGSAAITLKSGEFAPNLRARAPSCPFVLENNLAVPPMAGC